VVRHWLDVFVGIHYVRRKHIIRFRYLVAFLTRSDAAYVYRVTRGLAYDKYSGGQT
jgi:hypothetical protein